MIYTNNRYHNLKKSSQSLAFLEIREMVRAFSLKWGDGDERFERAEVRPSRSLKGDSNRAEKA